MTGWEKKLFRRMRIMRRVDFKQIAKKGLYLTAVAFLFGVAVPANPSEAREYKDNNLTYNISRE